jgi:hypothetical protein
MMGWVWMNRLRILILLALASLLVLILTACVERSAEDDDNTPGDRPLPTPVPTEPESDDSEPDSTATPGTDTGEWFQLLETDKTYPEDHVGDEILELTESAEEFEEWWERFQLDDAPGADEIDWDQRVVLFVGTGESGSCPVELVDVQFDEDERLVDVMISQEAPPETMCTMDWTPRVFVIALDQSVLGDDELFGVITDPDHDDEDIDPDRLVTIRE